MISRINSLVKFSSDGYGKIPIDSAKGLIRLLCFGPEQIVPLHKHENADEFFYVVEGAGKITIGNKETDTQSGHIIKAPASIPHQWKNESQRLILLSVLIPLTSYKSADAASKMELT